MTNGKAVDEDELPDSITAEEVHYMELGITGVDPDNTAVFVQISQVGSISGLMPLKFHTTRDGKTIFRGPVFVGSFLADGSLPTPDSKITAIVRTPSGEERTVKEIRVYPAKGAWLKTRGGGKPDEYVAIDRYGRIYNRIKSTSTVAAMSSGTGLLWIKKKDGHLIL